MHDSLSSSYSEHIMCVYMHVVYDSSCQHIGTCILDGHGNSREWAVCVRELDCHCFRVNVCMCV